MLQEEEKITQAASMAVNEERTFLMLQQKLGVLRPGQVIWVRVFDV